MESITQKTTLYGWGFGKGGQLGIGDEKQMAKKLTKENQAILPVAVPKFTNIKSMSTYANFSFIITNENQVYGFGDNKKGRIGLGAERAQECILVPELVESLKDI